MLRAEIIIQVPPFSLLTTYSTLFIEMFRERGRKKHPTAAAAIGKVQCSKSRRTNVEREGEVIQKKFFGSGRVLMGRDGGGDCCQVETRAAEAEAATSLSLSLSLSRLEKLDLTVAAGHGGVGVCRKRTGSDSEHRKTFAPVPPTLTRQRNCRTLELVYIP